ncbi:MAG: hypothetical protein ACRELB_02070, partial [Polyangiaceae bacterium]
MMRRIRGASLPSLLLAAGLTLVTVVAACGSSGKNGGGGGGDDGGGLSDGSSSGGKGDGFGGSSGSSSGASSSGAGDSSVDADFPCDGCAPFPPQGTATCSPQTLGPPTLVYPLDGMLLPPNMNVLEVQWVPPTGAALFEVDFTNGITDVKVETPCNAITTVRGTANVGCGLTLPQQAWNDIANTNRDGDPVKVTVRATPAGGACVTASPQSVSLAFAKDDLTGGIYYWQSATFGGVAGTTGGIYYHDFGTFDPTPTPFYTSGGTGTCVGCHTLSKDGARMSLMTDDPDADDEYGDVKTHTMDVASRTVLGGKNMSAGFQTFTHDHALLVATTFKVMGAPPNTVPDTSFQVWNGDGTTLVATDPLPAGMQGSQPNLSWDDKTLVFVAPTYLSIATNTVSALGGAGGDDHFLGGSLWQAAFSTTSGALTGYTALLTATGTQSFYYPDQSVDANWIVLNENDDVSTANNTGDCFYSRQSRVKILHYPPQAGDVPLDLPNLNVASGLSNSWPRWSPAVTSYHGKPVLWVTFSSNRDYGLHLKNTTAGYPTGGSNFDNYYPPEGPTYDQPQPASKQGITFDAYASPQIWMAAVVVDPNRALDTGDRSYPAFWLPFQDVTAHNHSAQWVGQVQGGPPPGGDGGTGGNDSGAPACNEQGGACGSGGGSCCPDVVCCSGTCQY